MRRIFGLVIAGGLLFGLASAARAQVAVTVGGPYGGGVSVNTYPYGYGYSVLNGWSSLYPELYSVAAPNPWPYSYSSGYSGYVPSTSYLGTSAYNYYAYSPGMAAYTFPVYGAGYYGVAQFYGVNRYDRGFVGGLVNRALRW